MITVFLLLTFALLSVGIGLEVHHRQVSKKKKRYIKPFVPMRMTQRGWQKRN